MNYMRLDRRLNHAISMYAHLLARRRYFRQRSSSRGCSRNAIQCYVRFYLSLPRYFPPAMPIQCFYTNINIIFTFTRVENMYVQMSFFTLYPWPSCVIFCKRMMNTCVATQVRSTATRVNSAHGLLLEMRM